MKIREIVNLLLGKIRNMSKNDIIINFILLIFTIIYIYYIYCGYITINIIIKSIIVLILLFLYKILLMFSYVSYIKNWETSYLYDKKEFLWTWFTYAINNFFEILFKLMLILEKNNKKYYNLKYKSLKLMYGQNAKIKEYKSTWCFIIINILYYFPTNWPYLVISFLLKKYNLLLLWITSNKDVIGKKYFQQNWSGWYPKFVNKFWYIWVKKNIFFRLYQMIWILSYYKVKLINLTWKEFFKIRFIVIIFGAVLIISNLHPVIILRETDRISLWIKILIVFFFLFFFLFWFYRPLYYFILSFNKIEKHINNNLEIESNKLKFALQRIKFENNYKLYMLILNDQINRLYYLGDYLIFFNLYKQFINFVNKKTNGFYIKKYDNINQNEIILFFPVYHADNHSNFIENERIKISMWMIFVGYDIKSENINNIIKDMPWNNYNKFNFLFNKNYYPYMTWISSYLHGLANIIGFAIWEKNVKFHHIFKWRIDLELYKILYKNQNNILDLMEKELQEIEDLLYIYIIMLKILYEDASLLIKVNKELKVEWKVNEEIVNYQLIPDNFISNKNYLKVLNMLNKFNYLVNSYTYNYPDNNIFNFKKHNNILKVSEGHVVYSVWEYILDIEIKKFFNEFVFLNNEIFYQVFNIKTQQDLKQYIEIFNIFELRNRIISWGKNRSQSQLQINVMVLFVIKWMMDKHRICLSKFYNKEEIKYEDIFEIKSSYSDNEWLKIQQITDKYLRDNINHKEQEFLNTYINIYNESNSDKEKDLEFEIVNIFLAMYQYSYILIEIYNQLKISISPEIKDFESELFKYEKQKIVYYILNTVKIEYNIYPEAYLLNTIYLEALPKVCDSIETFFKKYQQYLYKIKFKEIQGEEINFEQKLKYLEELEEEYNKKYNNNVFNLKASQIFIEEKELKEIFYKNSKLGEELHCNIFNHIIWGRDKKNFDIIKKWNDVNKVK